MSTSTEQALIAHNPHWQGTQYQHTFKRSHEKEAIADLAMDEIQIITGIRRCGKSTLMLSLINHLMQTAEPSSVLYLNLDDPQYTSFCQDPGNLPQLLTLSEKITQHPVDYVLLDEIQNMQGWEKYIKSTYDSQQFKKIILSGSNANLLNSAYATLLSGRYIKTHIYPIAYHELLTHHHICDNVTLLKQKATALAFTDQLMQLGGFPRIHCLEDEPQKIKLLKHYYETIVLKDCIANHAIRDTHTLTQLCHYLISHLSSLYSYNQLQKTLGSNENTLQNYVKILQDAYFIHQVQQYDYSLKKQNKAKKKPYCIDNGLITAASFAFSDNHGKLLENLVYTELKKQGHEHIYYHHDTYECDFILHEPEPMAIQVCYALNEKNLPREIRGLQVAMEKYRLKKGRLITYDQDAQTSLMNHLTSDLTNIEITPFWIYFASQKR